MAERITSETKDSSKRGVELATRTAKSALGVVESVAASIWGESTLVWSDQGRWVRRVTRPGIKHVLGNRRMRLIR